jgi:hypothetical protein
MTRLNWDWPGMRQKRFRKTKILKFGWLLKLPNQIPGNCPKSQRYWPDSQRVPFGACYWTKWVQTWHAWTWRVNLPSFETPIMSGWTWGPKFELLKSKVKRLKFDQKVNGIDQKVNDYLLGQIHMKRLKMVWIDHFWVHLNRLQLKIDLKFDLKFDLKSDLKFDLEFGKYWTFSKRQSCERSQKSKIAMKQTGIESNGLKMEQIHPLKGSDLCWRSLKAKFDMKIWLESENESIFWSSEDTNRPKWSLLNAWKTWQWFWDALGA